MTFTILFLACLSVLCAGLYGFIHTHNPPSLSRTVLKAIPISALALISGVLGGPVPLTLALALGAVGDVFLSRDGQHFFLAGLVAFLFGHIAYIYLLIGLGNDWTHVSTDTWRLVACATLIGIAGIVVHRLLPHLGNLRLPVLAYVCVILMMGVTALSLPSNWPLGFATLGAMLFVASDAILAFEVFVFEHSEPKRRWTAPALWSLYWGGQSIITGAVLTV